MSVEKIQVDAFLEMAKDHPILDVRSPAEYQHAHIPGAVPFPLFTDEERKQVGTAYKQQGRESAIKIGLDYFGPNMRRMVEAAESLVTARGMDNRNHRDESSPFSRILLVHCWRGGMRSAAVAWLLDLYGFRVFTLIGGYKKFRNWVLRKFEEPYCLHLVGGYTGSGKTRVLKELERSGQCVIDLEFLASHKGSAFGNIGMPSQPGQEMFENLLALELHAKWKGDGETSVLWMEDESQRIGDVNIPMVFWTRMRHSPLFFLDIPFEERLNHITEEYGSLDRNRMASAIERIKKRLGGLETKTALAFLEEGNLRECFRVLLKYYDKWYRRGLYNREDPAAVLNLLPCSRIEPAFNAKQVLLKKTEKIHE